MLLIWGPHFENYGYKRFLFTCRRISGFLRKPCSRWAYSMTAVSSRCPQQNLPFSQILIPLSTSGLGLSGIIPPWGPGGGAVVQSDRTEKKNPSPQQNLKLCDLHTAHKANIASLFLPHPKLKCWDFSLPLPPSLNMLPYCNSKTEPGNPFKADSICMQIMEDLSFALQLFFVALAWVSL